jgi:hypothetical protein
VLGRRSLPQLRGRCAGVSVQALSHRLRRALQQFVAGPRELALPWGDLVLVADGLWFRFQGGLWVLYLMALKPCRQNRATFLDPVLLPGRESRHGWMQAFATLPATLQPRIRAVVTDDLQGMTTLAAQRHWVLQLCHFHLISQLHMRRGRVRSTVGHRRRREALYQLTRRALVLPDGAAFTLVVRRLEQLVAQPLPSSRMRMVVREFLRRRHLYRAYRAYPDLDLPTTTGAVEAMGKIIRRLMHRLANVRTPQALQRWATALIRLRPNIMCNGTRHQQNSFV